MAGTGKKIVRDEILLTITGPDVPNLTLIDLPGFTKVDTDDQEKGVSKGIESLCLEYIEKENTVILALCPATGDIATADSLQYAQMVDPQRERTFGVVTKIDIMDKGTDAIEHLSGCKYKLKYGFIGVKCRSQEDNNNNKLICEALKDEKEYFMTHPVYASIAHEQGTEVLGDKLSKLLTENIIKQLPNVEKFIDERLEHNKQILLSLGKKRIFTSDYEMRDYFYRIVDKYGVTYSNLVQTGPTKESCYKYLGGSKISYIFQEFSKSVINKIDPLDHLADERIFVEIKQTQGVNPELFVSDEACRKLIEL